jgi:monoamine oxidase
MWFHDVNLSDSNGPFVLIAFATVDLAKPKLKQSNAEVLADVCAQLDEMYARVYSLSVSDLPGLGPRRRVRPMCSSTVSSHPSTKTRTLEGPTGLAAPLPHVAIMPHSAPTVNEGNARDLVRQPVDGRVFFAGEHTHAITGMVHTAIDTGSRAAAEVLASLSL